MNRATAVVLSVTGTVGLLVSGASALPDSTPARGESEQSELLPRGAKPDPRGPHVLVKSPGADGRTWELLTFRQRAKGPAAPGREVPGTINYCLATISNGAGGNGRRRWRGVTCALSTAIARKLTRKGLYLECSDGGFIVGRPVEPGVICGLVPADVNSVTVSPDGGQAVQEAPLSERFDLKINRQRRVLKRAGIDPDRGRNLPASVAVRAFLFAPDHPATPPGQKTPRFTVTATGPGTETHTARVGGHRILEPDDAPQPPPFKPPPGARRVDVAAAGPAGQRWSATTYEVPPTGRSRQRVICSSVTPRPAKQPVALSCANDALSLQQLVKSGVAPAIATDLPRKRPAGKRRSCAVFGLTQAAATEVLVRDRRGKRWRATLSKGEIGLRRNLTGIRGPYRRQLQRLPRRLRARAFLVVLSSCPSPESGQDLGFRVTLSNGRVLRDHWPR